MHFKTIKKIAKARMQGERIFRTNCNSRATFSNVAATDLRENEAELIYVTSKSITEVTNYHMSITSVFLRREAQKGKGANG